MIHHLKFSFRTLRKNPGFSTLAILTLGLGIGANTIIFSVFNGVVLSPLPYADAGSIAVVTNTWSDGRLGLSEKEFLRYQTLDEVFESLGAYEFRGLNITLGDRAERVFAGAMSSEVLHVLGVSPLIGRDFSEDDDIRGAPGVVLLSHDLWNRGYAADPGVVGAEIVLDGTSMTIVGVMPPSFRLPGDFIGQPIKLYIPLAFEPTPDPRNLHYLNSVARLNPGVTLDQGSAMLATTATRLVAEFGTLPDTFSAKLIAVHDEIVGDVRPALLILLAAVAFVLLIASVNVANLMLSRGEVRQYELAVRHALGASRRHLLTILFVDVAVLASAGSILGVILAYWGTRLLVASAPSNLPRVEQIGIDAKVLAFAMGMTLISGLVFGLFPALRTSRRLGGESLTGGTRGGSAGAPRQRARRALVVSEIALAATLALGAGLMVKSFARLSSVDPGFDAQGVLTFTVNLPEGTYGDSDSARRFYGSLLPSVRALPGVTSAGAIRNLPLASGIGDWGIRIKETGPDGQGKRGPKADWHVVTPGYFEAMRIPLIEGRYLRDDDRVAALNAVVINDKMAHLYWPDGSALGAQFRMTTDIDTMWRTVVGVVGDVKQRGLDDTITTAMYLPHAQFPSTANFPVGRLTVVVRSSLDPLSLTAPILREVRALDPNVPVTGIGTMEEIVSRASAEQRFQGTLFSLAALVALVLVFVGVYGVTNFLVSQRIREFGIRVAVGATTRNVLWLVMGEGLLLTSLGLTIGIAGSVGLSRFLSSVLFGVTTYDPQTFVTAPLVIGVATTMATLLPAFRATRVDPVTILRQE